MEVGHAHMTIDKIGLKYQNYYKMIKDGVFSTAARHQEANQLRGSL